MLTYFIIFPALQDFEMCYREDCPEVYVNCSKQRDDDWVIQYNLKMQYLILNFLNKYDILQETRKIVSVLKITL